MRADVIIVFPLKFMVIGITKYLPNRRDSSTDIAEFETKNADNDK